MCAQLKVYHLHMNTDMPQNGYNWDGIHLNRTGTEVLANTIEAYLKGDIAAMD